MNGVRPALPPSPPHSVARSSTTTSMYSVAGNHGVRKYSQQMLEEQLAEHHRALKEFLAQSIREDKAYQPHNRARDKLLRLSTIQFQELSTDVYDELLRREDERAAAERTQPSEARVPKYLLPKNNFHPKRNQARQKLSTLAAKKFRELATDVLFELERRNPQFTGAELERVTSPSGSARSFPVMNGGGSYGPSARRPSATSSPPYSPGVFDQNDRGYPNSAGGQNSDYGKPLPRTFHADTMVPNKSTMVEDDDDEEQSIDDASSAYGLGGTSTARSSRRTTNASNAMKGRDSNFIAENMAQVSRLEQRIRELEDQLKQKDEEVGQKRDLQDQLQQKDNELNQARNEAEAEQNRHAKLTMDLEQQLTTANEVNNSLQAEISNLKEFNNSLQGEISNIKEANSQKSESGSDEWRTHSEALEKELYEQRKVTEEVRQEASQSLQEMRLLAERNDQAMDHEESLMQQVSQLEIAVSDWKSRYAKTKTQLRSLRATSMGLYIDNPDATHYAKEPGFNDPNGIIKDVSVTKFQIAVDELLHSARAQDPSAVQDYVRNVVMCVRTVADDVDSASTKGTEDAIKKRAKIKARVVAACNHMVSAARTFANSKGLSPVSIIDAAATNLTGAIIELIKVAKVRSTPTAELEDDDNEAFS